MVWRHLLLQCRRRLGISLKRINRIDPVKRVQVIEMHQVIMYLQRQLHDIPYAVGVLGNIDTQRIFHGTY